MYTTQIAPSQTYNAYSLKALESPQYIPLQTLSAPSIIQAAPQPQLTTPLYQSTSLLVTPQPQPQLVNSTIQTSYIAAPTIQLTVPVQQYQPKLIPAIPYPKFIPPTPTPQEGMASAHCPTIYQFYKHVPVVQPITQQGSQYQTLSHSVVPTGSFMVVQ